MAGIAEWIAPQGVNPGSLVAYAKESYDAQAYEAMRAFRGPIGMTHYYTFYALLVVVVMHVAAVIITEIHEGGSLVSAMFTGRKIIAGAPLDAAASEDQIASKNAPDDS